nr:serine/arginine-rich splicing factor RS31-like isoform X2 [Tanacetum cinerariifolium]
MKGDHVKPTSEKLKFSTADFAAIDVHIADIRSLLLNDERNRHRNGSKSVLNQRRTKTLFVINFDLVHTKVLDIEKHFEPYGKIHVHGKDHPPMLAPVAEGSSKTTTEGYMKNYKNVSQDIRKQLDAEAEGVQIVLTGINNDIYSIINACPNACEIWKAIERLKQGESINVQDLKTILYWEFGKFTSRDGESLESY